MRGWVRRAATPKVANRGTLLGRWQHIEYVMGFNLDRRLLATLGAITTVPGAAGAFRATALHDVGELSEEHPHRPLEGRPATRPAWQSAPRPATNARQTSE